MGHEHFIQFQNIPVMAKNKETEEKEVRLLPVIEPENAIEVLQKLRAPFYRDQIQYRALAMPGSFKRAVTYDNLGWYNKPDSDPMWKGVKGVKAIAPVAFYVDARDIEDRLDRTVGPFNWQTKSEVYHDGALVKLGIYYNGEWIWKEDGSERTDIEGFKGAISKGLVRAASSWGIGRYFYEMKYNFPVKMLDKDGKKWGFDNKYDGSWTKPQDIIEDHWIPEE